MYCPPRRDRKTINRTHAHRTHRQRKHPRPAHTRARQDPQTNTSHKHLTTLNGGATTVRATSHARVGDREKVPLWSRVWFRVNHVTPNPSMFNPVTNSSITSTRRLASVIRKKKWKLIGRMVPPS